MLENHIELPGPVGSEDINDENKNGDTRTIEGFVYDELVLTNQLTLSGGYRYSRFPGTFQDENYTDFFLILFYPTCFFPGVEWVY